MSYEDTAIFQTSSSFSSFQLSDVALTSVDPILRCAAGEALGRMAQVIGDPKFISTMAQVCIFLLM